MNASLDFYTVPADRHAPIGSAGTAYRHCAPLACTCMLDSERDRDPADKYCPHGSTSQRTRGGMKDLLPRCQCRGALMR